MSKKIDKRLKFFLKEKRILEKILKKQEGTNLENRLAIVKRAISALEQDIIPSKATISEIISNITESFQD